MNFNVKKLPDNPVLLKQKIFEIHSTYQAEKVNFENTIANFKTEISNYENKLKKENFRYLELEEKFLILQRKFFSKRSEKLSKEELQQLLLFNEAETHAEGADSAETANSTEGTTKSRQQKEIRVRGHRRRKRGRKRLPDHIFREEVTHDLSSEEKKCFCGKERPCIGSETTEELDIVPAQIRIIKHIRKKYGPCDCDKFFESEIPEVKTAPMPARMIPGSIVSPGLLAYVVVSKYTDSLPFYRQSKMFKRIDVDISRATMCNWALLAAKKCQPLIEIMKEDIKSGRLIQMDETTLQVLKEPGRAAQSKSYMWVTVGYPEEESPAILYKYHTGRSGKIPVKFLEGYSGFLQTDGYTGYNKAGGMAGVTHVGCFAHSRRKFYDASKLSKKSKTAFEGLEFIGKLYNIENALRAKDLPVEEFLETRRSRAGPVLDKFHKWLLLKQTEIPPRTAAGKAVSYTLKEWNKLVRYLESEILTPDNNVVENAIRPFVVGRKNWLFSNTPRGAHASAVLYSLLETAKSNNLEPYKYLRYLFYALPICKTENDRRLLLPYNIDPESIRNL